MKNWNHYDTNMNNNLVEQRKILFCKNYEIDSRAQGLKDYGVQPFMKTHLNKQKKINDILFDQLKGKSPEERLPQYKKNFTPITTYMKSIVDSRVTKNFKGLVNV